MNVTLNSSAAYERRQDRLLFVLLAIAAVVLLWSGVAPRERFTWWLEVLPAILGAALLAATIRRFRFSTLVYVLIAMHALILMVGGKYTYAEVPIGDWFSSLFGWSRNHYDRLGHFAQGFVPAMIARELLLRKTPLKQGGWLFYIVFSICLAISAMYEFIEWFAAVTSGEAADAFLGTQGDIWDTQTDMLMASIGAIAAQLLLGRMHDRSMVKVAPGV